MLKVDMTAAMSIVITYTDNDGRLERSSTLQFFFLFTLIYIKQPHRPHLWPYSELPSD